MNTITVKGHTFTTWILADCIRIMSEEAQEIIEISNEALASYYGGSADKFFGRAIGEWLAY